MNNMIKKCGEKSQIRSLVVRQ